MKFEIKRHSSKDIEVYTFDIYEPEKEKFFSKWKKILTIAIASSFITAAIIFCFFNIDGIGVEFSNNRETTVLIRKKNDQERNSESSDGTSSSFNRTSEKIEGEN